MRRHGFSLIELSMVLAVAGLMLGFALELTQSSNKVDCYAATQAQLPVIHKAMEQFARTYDRLPMPAARNVGVEDINYGREALAAAITQAAGVSFGALPFQALGLSPAYAADCWGNKFTYVVTTALTTSSDSGGYLDDTVTGNLAIKISTATSTSTTAAYAVISHGADELGAVERNYSGISKGWCTDAISMKTMNCRADAAQVGSTLFNDGDDAAANYFDDLVISSGKPVIISENTVTSNLFCWGYNADGQLGDGSNTRRETPTPVDSELNFTAIASANYHSCGIAEDGNTYCWGYNTYGALGSVGASTNTPRVVSGGLSFASITAGESISCALTSTGTAYCWGYNGGGQLGVGHSSTPQLSPDDVSGGLTFKDISAGYSSICGITTTGAAYCWGSASFGGLGDGSMVSSYNAPHLVSNPTSGAVTYRDIEVGTHHVCALTTDDKAYCWGKNDYYQLGDGGSSNQSVPTPVSGGRSYKQLVVGHYLSCGLTLDNDAYCWGNGTAVGNPFATYSTPQLISGYKFERLGGGSTHTCGVTSDMKVYCWGINSQGQLGDGGTTNHYTPTLVSGSGSSPLHFTSISKGGSHSCALRPLTVTWGNNTNGSVGDGTNTNRPYPTIISMPEGVNYFTAIGGFGDDGTKCGIGDDGRAYCWGYNNAGQVGDGTKTNRNTPGEVPLPSGVNYFKSIVVGNYNSCAIGDDNKPYCWGNGDISMGWAAPNAPTLVSIPPTTATAIHLWAYGGNIIGTDGQVYSMDTNYGITGPWTLPGGVTSVKAAIRSSSNSCILGNDDQVYCNGCSDTYCAIGDGSTSASSAALLAVTPPTASFKALHLGINDGGWSIACAIGDNNRIYCWGNRTGQGLIGDNNGGYATAYVPTATNLPSGISGFSSVFVASPSMSIATGFDGKTYYWGKLWTVNPWPGAPGSIQSNEPTLLPLPNGVSGLAVYNGSRIGLTY